MAGDLGGNFEENITDWFSFVKVPKNELESGYAKGENDRIFRMTLGRTSIPKSLEERYRP
jgi:hypothetical protein